MKYNFIQNTLKTDCFPESTIVLSLLPFLIFVVCSMYSMYAALHACVYVCMCACVSVCGTITVCFMHAKENKNLYVVEASVSIKNVRSVYVCDTILN